MRSLLLLLLLLPAIARGETIEELLLRKIDRPIPKTPEGWDYNPRKIEQSKLRWQFNGEAGRFRYSDTLGDGQDGKFTIKGGGFRQLVKDPRTIVPTSIMFTIRKQF